MKGVLVVSDFAVSPVVTRADADRFARALEAELPDRCEQFLPEIGRVSARVAIATAEHLSPRALEFLAWEPGRYDPARGYFGGGSWRIDWPAVCAEVRVQYRLLLDVAARRSGR